MADLKNRLQGPIMPEQFFDFYDSVRSKQMLWKWFVTTVTDGYGTCTQIEKENIVTFYERLKGLLEGLNDSTNTKSSDPHE